MAQAREAETDLAVRAAWLSFVGGYTQEQIARRLGVSRVKVRRFPTDKSSPAKQAGVLVGDIVLAVGDRRLVTRRDLMTAVAECAPGETVMLEIWRSGDILNVPVTLSERVSVEVPSAEWVMQPGATTSRWSQRLEKQVMRSTRGLRSTHPKNTWRERFAS